MEALERFDSRGAYEILMRAATFLDRRALAFGMVVPLVEEVAIRWTQGELGVAQEHMVSSQLRSVVSSMLRFTPPRAQATQLLLTTPPGHRSELGVLVSALLAATKGLDPLYLGPDLPLEELQWAIRMSKAELLVLSVVREVSSDELQTLPGLIEQLAADVQVWVDLPKNHALNRVLKSCRVFHDFESFDSALSELVDD